MKGTCLCGAVEVVAGDATQIGLCHCSMCRRWTGGPFFAVEPQANTLRLSYSLLGPDDIDEGVRRLARVIEARIAHPGSNMRRVARSAA